MAKLSNAPQRIAILKPSALGDIVHALPVLSALRNLYPQARLSWIVNRSYADLLAGHPHLDQVLTFDRQSVRRGWWSSIREGHRLIRQMREQQWDLLIDLQGLLRTGLIAKMSGARIKMGLSSAREGAVWFYNQVVDVPTMQMHAVDRYWRVIEVLGGGALSKEFHLPVDPQASQWAEDHLLTWPPPWIMVNLGTRWETKRWPVEHFAALIRHVQERFGGTACLVGGADDVHLSQAFIRAMGPNGSVRDFVGQTSLKQLVALLARADLVLSNDSGPLHIADALGRPVLAPFMCTSPLRTGPYKQPDAVESTKVACAASYLKRCSRMDCMSELVPARFHRHLEVLLQPWNKRIA